MSKSFSSVELFNRVKKIPGLAIKNENEFRTLINQYNRGELDKNIMGLIKEEATESFINTTKARSLIAENIKKAIGQEILKSETDINIRYNEKIGHNNKLHKEFRDEVK